MDLDEFLGGHGVGLADVVARVDDANGLTPTDVLLVVGSLIEGLGTSRTDLDLLIVADESARALPDDDEHVVVVGRCLADVRVLPRARADGLLDRLDAWAAEPWNVSRATKFDNQDRVLLHRLLHGIPVLRDGASADAVPRPSAAALARLKFHVARHLARTVQVDMAGHRAGGDAASLVFAAQDLLGHAVDALTAAYGLTNPNPKWRSRLLDHVPHDWEASLGTRPSGVTAAALVWQLHRAPEHPELDAAVQHALRITSFARAVFTWGERLLVTGGTGAGHDGGWTRLGRPTRAPLPHLDIDVDVQLASTGAVLGRLNSFGTTVPLSPAELAAVMLFDGTTTADEAAAVVGGPTDVLLSRVVASGLCAP